MNQKIQLIIFLLLFSVCANAQHLIKGQVVDKETGLPIENVNIRILSSSKGTFTDSQGKFEFKSEKKNSKVEASHVSYENPTVKIRSRSNSNLIEMERGLFSIDEVKIGFGEDNSPSNYHGYNEIEYKKIYQERENSTIEEKPSGGEEEKVFIEQQPMFLGGIENLKAFFVSNLKFPQKVIEANKVGRVFLIFQIDEKGNGVNPEVVGTDIDYDMGQEVLRIFKLMPRWLPATQRKSYEKVNLVLPITYSTKGIKDE